MIKIKTISACILIISTLLIYSGCGSSFSASQNSVSNTSNDTHTDELVMVKQSTAIAAGGDYSVVLKKEGTVVAVGNNKNGQCNVSGWKDIVAIAAGNSHTVGLKKDGTVVAVGLNDHGQCNVSEWKDITAISAGEYHTVGLKKDGTVVATGMREMGRCDVASWKDIIAVSAGDSHTVGLTRDGTVVAAGSNLYGESDVSSWKDIIAVSAGSFCTAGLAADGSARLVGEDPDQKSDVSGWTDLAAISAGYPIVGLNKYGTAVVYGSYSQYYPNTKITVTKPYDVSEWIYMVEVDAGNTHIIGLTEYGMVMAIGNNSDGQCDVSELNDLDTGTVSTSSDTSKTSDETNTQGKEYFALNEEVSVNETILIISKVEKVSGPEYTTLDDDQEFVIITVTIKNKGNNEFRYTSSDFALQNSQGEARGFATTKANEDSRLRSGNLASGDAVTGTITFKAPKDDPVLVLRYCDNTLGENAVYINVN